MSRIFICHAPADCEAVEALMRSLVVAGARQEDVEAERDAPEGIRRAGVVMLYASQHSLDDTERLTSVRLAACYAVPVVLALAPDVRSDDVRLADIDATIVDSAEAASLATVSSALGAAGEDRQPRIFISYSRRDLDRARALALALRARRLRVFLDLANLQPGEDWLARLYAYIDDADAVIFAISSASLSSAICADEVARAQAAGKRVLPVRIATITEESLERAPKQLRRLNQVFAAAPDNWTSALEEIEAWATRDADWHRAHSELFRAARAWDAGSRPPDRLLRGAVLEGARATLANRPQDAPDSPALVGEFIIASGTQQLFEENRLFRGVANGFAARAQDAIAQQRYTLATKCAAAAAVMAKDPRFSPDRAATVWKIAARAVSRAAISVLVGHRGYVSSARFSADETTVLTSGADGTCRIWELNTGSEKVIYRQHEGKVNFASLSPDDELVVSAGEDGTARLWQARDGLTLRTLLGHEAAVNRAVFTIDGRFIVTTSDDWTIRLWDVSTGANVRVFEEHTRDVLEAVLSPDGLRLATTSQDGTIRLWDLASGDVRQPRCLSTVTASGRPIFSTADFSPDGGCVLSASVTGEVFIWDTHTTDQRLAVRAHDDLILTARFAPDGRRFVTAGSLDHIGRVWDSSTGALVATLTGHSQRVSCAAFSPDGNRIVTGSADGTARIWVASTGQELWRSDRHGKELTTAVWSRTGSRILTASRDGTACIWGGYVGPTLAIDCSVGAVVDAVDNDTVSVFAVVGKDRSTRIFDLWSRRERICQSPNEEWDNIVLFSPDGACLLTGSETRLALVKTDDCSVLLKVRANRAWTKQAVFSQAGERIGIATRDGRISVLDAKTGEELSISREKRASVSTLAFSPDARVIASGHHDGSVSIWRGDNGRLVHHLQAHGGSVRTVAFSPNGTLIASAGWDSPVLISRGADGTLLHRIIAETSVVDKVAFLPDSRNLLMQSRGGSVQTVDALTGSPGIRFDIRGGGFFVFALSPCGRWMATANWDGDVQLWHVQSGVELASAYGDWDNVFVLRCSCEGRMLVVADLNRIFVWDCAAETAAFSIDAREDPLVVVAAALSSGVGTLLEHEREDFIFNDTPSDLSLALNALMTSDQRSQIVPTARTLHADRASDAYRNSALRPPRQSSPSAPLSAPSPQTE